jgi:hypothetical protein
MEQLEFKNRVISHSSRDLEEKLGRLENELLRERLQRRNLDNKKPNTKNLVTGFPEESKFRNASATTLPKAEVSWTITKDEKT